MTFTGLEENYYLLNNPIYLEAFGGNDDDPPLDENFLLNINIGGRVIDIQMFNNYAIVDLSPIIKTLLGTPNYEVPNSNIITIDIQILYYDTNEETGVTVDFEDLTFIRGGQYTGFNNHLENGDILKVSELIPVWTNYPSYTYTLTGTSIIEVENVLGAVNEVLRERGCENVYLKFRNALGGYSHYLFETYTVQHPVKSGEVINRFSTNKPQNNFYSLGGESVVTLQVETRFLKKHYGILNSLVESEEVWVYQFNKLINSEFIFSASEDWTKIENAGNSIMIESGEEAQDVALNFNIHLTKDLKLV